MKGSPLWNVDFRSSLFAETTVPAAGSKCLVQLQAPPPCGSWRDGDTAGEAGGSLAPSLLTQPRHDWRLPPPTSRSVVRSCCNSVPFSALLRCRGGLEGWRQGCLEASLLCCESGRGIWRWMWPGASGTLCHGIQLTRDRGA